MIGSLRGVLLDRVPRPGGAEVLLEPAFLYVHTHVREDAIVLYGFPTREERTCFEALIGAHGVGPGLALAILSVHSPPALRRVLATDDVDGLTLVPGVGKKTAVRLLVELKAKLDMAFDTDDVAFSVVGLAGGNAAAAGPRAEVRVALAGLGYGHDEVREALAGLPEAGEVEDLLRAALKTLAGAR